MKGIGPGRPSRTRPGPEPSETLPWCRDLLVAAASLLTGVILTKTAALLLARLILTKAAALLTLLLVILAHVQLLLTCVGG